MKERPSYLSVVPDLLAGGNVISSEIFARKLAEKEAKKGYIGQVAENVIPFRRSGVIVQFPKK